MSYSETYEFTINAGEAITEALENIGVIEMGGGIDAQHVSSLVRSFNLYLRSDQSKKLGLWTWKDAVLFLEKDESQYLLGPTGDHASESYVSTTLSADAAANATVVSLSLPTGISNADKIGIVLDSGALFWTTVSAIGGTTIADALPSGASSGNVVFAYTLKIQRPMAIKDVRLYHIDNTERPCNPIAISEYNLYPNKTTSSEIVNYSYEPLVDNSRLKVWPANTLTTDVLKFQHKKPIDDIRTTDDNVYAPVDCLDAIILGFTARLASKYALPLAEQKAWEQRAKDTIDAIYDFESDTSISFAPWGGQ